MSSVRGSKYLNYAHVGGRSYADLCGAGSMVLSNLGCLLRNLNLSKQKGALIFGIWEFTSIDPEI